MTTVRINYSYLCVWVGDVVSESWLRAAAAGPAASFAYASAAATAVGHGTGKSPPSDQSAVYREWTREDSTGEAADTATTGDAGTEGEDMIAMFSFWFVSRIPEQCWC